MKVSWDKLFPRHHRLIPFWVVAGMAIALPWAWSEWGGSGASLAATRTCTVASIYDGDTIRATCDGEAVKLRLHCIDTPEMGQRPWGKESRDALRAMVPKRFEYRVRDKGRDRYGRIIAEVFDPTAPDTPLNLVMVQRGHAAVYTKYCIEPRDRGYHAAEDSARAAGLGIWEKPGDHQAPWDYRHRK